MAVRTLAELETFLDEALAWRRAELTALVAEASRQEKLAAEAPLTRALSRSGAALLYAHWEGYAKEACEAYLDFVAVRRLRYEELGDGLLLTALKGLLRRVESGDPTAHVDAMDLVRRPREARARVPRKSVINTRANLRYEVLVEMCEAVGLPTDDFVTRRHFIDRAICDARNEISHGRLYYSDAETFERHTKDVLRMLDTLRTTIIRHARVSLYKRNPG